MGTTEAGNAGLHPAGRDRPRSVPPGAVPAIEVRGLTRAFESKMAVHDVNATVGAGEVVGLVGINGAGKTTFLRMLAGILQPTKGSVFIGGHLLEGDAPEARKRLAFVPDTPMLFDPLTVWEHLMFVARLYQVQGFEAKAEEVLREFDLLDRRNETAASLSRGMRQKLAICCAFLHEPSAYLLDEPLTGLDPPGRRRMCDAVAARAAAGSAVIISSHQLEFVERLSSRLLIIHGGKIVASGTIDEIRTALGQSGDGATLEDIFLRATGSEEGPRA